MLFLRRTLPLITAFVCGCLAIALYYIPHAAAQNAERDLARWDRIVAAFAMLLGIHSLVHLHWGRIRQQQPGWGYSLLVYTGLVLMVSFAIYNDGAGPLAPLTLGSGPFDWMFKHVQVPADSTMFSILAFFIASAAYRTFRARTPEAAILLVAAVVVMLGRVPLGAYISGAIPSASDWLMNVPQMAAKRGILLGVSLGAIATSLRIIFGIERAYLGGGEE